MSYNNAAANAAAGAGIAIWLDNKNRKKETALAIVDVQAAPSRRERAMEQLLNTGGHVALYRDVGNTYLPLGLDDAETIKKYGMRLGTFTQALTEKFPKDGLGVSWLFLPVLIGVSMHNKGVRTKYCEKQKARVEELAKESGCQVFMTIGDAHIGLQKTSHTRTFPLVECLVVKFLEDTPETPLSGASSLATPGNDEPLNEPNPPSAPSPPSYTKIVESPKDVSNSV